jgi:hypothetical protein
MIAFGIYGLRYQQKQPQLRHHPVFASLSNEVGRVAEQGSIIHVALGRSGLLSNNAMPSIATLQSLRALVDLAAAYDTPPLVTTSDPTLYLLTRDWMWRAYVRIGNPTHFRPDFVQFIAASPAVYAAMAATYLHDGNVGSNVMLGTFDQEISLLAGAAHRQRIANAGGSTALSGLAAAFPLLDDSQFVMGEDMFAGPSVVDDAHSAYSVSLQAQEVLRWVIILAIIVIAIMSSLGIGGY